MGFIKVGDATPILKVLSEDELKKEQEKSKQEQQKNQESLKKIILRDMLLDLHIEGKDF